VLDASAVDPSAVDGVIREVGTVEVVARFDALTSDDIGEKSPGDYVTIADQECERVLTERLRQLRDIAVVGEEATTADPDLLNLIEHSEACWVIDPIDGTANFVNGSTDYVVMVALVEAGEMAGAWVWHPHTDTMLHATSLTPTTREGSIPTRARERSTPVGVIKRAYMPEPAKQILRELPPHLGELAPGRKCAGIEYGQLIDGEIDFLFYWRTFPWDHAPGGLLAQQAGMRVARLDGSPYRPGDNKHGLLSATPELWPLIAAEINQALARDLPT